MRAVLMLLLIPAVYAAPFPREIGRATAYLEKKTETLDGVSVVILHFLKQRHRFQINLGSAPARILKKHPVRIRPLMRLLDSSQRLSELEIRTLKGAPGLFGPAIYCDIYPLPWNYFETVRRYTEGGAYAVTQALQAMAMISPQACQYDTQAYQKLFNALADQIPPILDGASVGSDLWLEAALSLFNSRREREIPLASWKKMLALQLPNGSWEDNGAKTTKVLHLLILACESGYAGYCKKR